MRNRGIELSLSPPSLPATTAVPLPAQRARSQASTSAAAAHLNDAGSGPAAVPDSAGSNLALANPAIHGRIPPHAASPSDACAHAASCMYPRELVVCGPPGDGPDALANSREEGGNRWGTLAPVGSARVAVWPETSWGGKVCAADEGLALAAEGVPGWAVPGAMREAHVGAAAAAVAGHWPPPGLRSLRRWVRTVSCLVDRGWPLGPALRLGWDQVRLLPLQNLGGAACVEDVKGQIWGAVCLRI